ncbi:MAG: NAD(P)H-binding protein [Chitinophagaceae bacterium]|jgi:uncharacterized protein YbjT (DUF2867 family)
MNYVITGSIGHISKPIVAKLIAEKHHVTVITSNQNRVAEIENIGAKALVGSVSETEFITKAFDKADVVYLMIPPNWNVTNWFEYQKQVANNYITAIQTNAVKKVVLLSSIGAHLRKGAGPIDGLGYLEEKLLALKDIDTIALRPSYFYYNLFSLIPLIKQANIIGGNFGGNEKLVLVDTNDIAKVAIDALLTLNFKGFQIQYIASDERLTSDIAKVLGTAIGKPDLPWVIFSDEQNLQGLLAAGLSNTIAEGYTQMGKSIREGFIQEDYWKNKPAMGKLTLEEFAEKFAQAYFNS